MPRLPTSYSTISLLLHSETNLSHCCSTKEMTCFCLFIVLCYLFVHLSVRLRYWTVTAENCTFKIFYFLVTFDLYIFVDRRHIIVYLHATACIKHCCVLPPLSATLSVSDILVSCCQAKYTFKFRLWTNWATQPPIEWLLGVHHPGGKWQECAPDHLPPPHT
jgi:hypothetical protein